MKVEFNQDKAISKVVQGTGAVSGMLVGKVGMSFAPPVFQKPIVKTIVGVMLLVGSSTIQGKGTLVDGAKGFGFGVGAINVAEGVAGLIKPSVDGLAEGSKTKELASKAIAGLAGVEEKMVNLPASAWDNASYEQVKYEAPKENVV